MAVLRKPRVPLPFAENIINSRGVHGPLELGKGQGSGEQHSSPRPPPLPLLQRHIPKLSDSDKKVTPYKSLCPEEAPVQEERHIGDPCRRVTRTGVQSAQKIVGAQERASLTLTPIPPCSRFQPSVVVAMKAVTDLGFVGRKEV